MKKNPVFLIGLLIVLFFFNGISLVNADEKESTVTVTIHEGVFSDMESDNNETNEDALEKKQAFKKLPQTDEKNSPIFLLLGVMICLVSILGWIYIKNRNGEKYIEKS